MAAAVPAAGRFQRRRELCGLFDSALLAALGAVQVLEPKIPALASTRGRLLWLGLKLVLGYLLIGYTGGIIDSRYWPVLLLPVVSAATSLGVFGTLAFALVAGLAYSSLLSFLDLTRYQIDAFGLILRIIFFAMVGNLANTLAEDLRMQSANHRRTAEQLAEANVHIQQAEEAVRRSDRLAALGQLSAGLAHELRNPLGTIRRRRRCSAATSARKTRWRARWPASSPPKWTAPTR